MSDERQLMKVPVSALCPGLYVAELDRPWTEVPLMFQGFQIRDQEELDILERYCRVVYIDTGRSRSEAVRALPASGEGGDAGGARDPGPRAERRMTERSDIADVFGAARQPDKDAFRELVSEAAETRGEVHRLITDVMRDVRIGENVDAGNARELVGDLAEVVSRNTSASLWLTNLKRRDEYTTRHSVNVCVLMLAFGVQLGFERAELERMAFGALLQDIGKMRTPDEILNKPGDLTPDEWAIVRRHPEDGYEIVSQMGHVPRETLEIIRLHHERLDGSGYPFGLQGGQIPLHARIAGLLDTYDAMTSPRSFQDAMPADRVLQQLYNESDRTFGQTPVQQFIRCVGVYPVGSLVELDNGAAGIVLGSRPDARIQPTVLMVRTPDGDFYEKRLLLNLAADAEAGGPAARRVKRVLDPATEGIDVASIVAIEFGLDEAGFGLDESS